MQCQSLLTYADRIVCRIDGNHLVVWADQMHQNAESLPHPNNLPGAVRDSIHAPGIELTSRDGFSIRINTVYS